MFLRKLERDVLSNANGKSVNDIYDAIKLDSKSKKRTMYNIVGFLSEGGYLAQTVKHLDYGKRVPIYYYTITEKGKALLDDDDKALTLKSALHAHMSHYREKFAFLSNRKVPVD